MHAKVVDLRYKSTVGTIVVYSMALRHPPHTIGMREASWLGGRVDGRLTTSALMAEHSNSAGTGFAGGGMPSPQRRPRRTLRPHELEMIEHLAQEKTAFFPSPSSQVSRASKRLASLEADILAEQQARGLAEVELARVTSESFLLSSASTASMSQPRAGWLMPLRTLGGSGIISPSLSRSQSMGPMAIVGQRQPFNNPHRGYLTPLERRVTRSMTDQAALSPSSPRESGAAAYDSALRHINDHGVGILFKPSRSPPWKAKSRPVDKPLQGFSGVIGI